MQELLFQQDIGKWKKGFKGLLPILHIKWGQKVYIIKINLILYKLKYIGIEMLVMKKHLKPYTNILCKILFYELVE